MSYRKSKDWYYMKLVPAGSSKPNALQHYLGSIYGYTDNRWLMACYIQTNRAFINRVDCFLPNIPIRIQTVQFFGTLGDFHDAMKREYGQILTGADILDIFESDNHTCSLFPRERSVNVVSTCTDVLGGRFDYIACDRFLKKDWRRLCRALLFFARIVDEGLLRQFNREIHNTVEVLYDHPFMGYCEFAEMGNCDNFLNYYLDTVRYGILVGRFLQL